MYKMSEETSNGPTVPYPDDDDDDDWYMHMEYW